MIPDILEYIRKEVRENIIFLLFFLFLLQKKVIPLRTKIKVWLHDLN